MHLSASQESQISHRFFFSASSAPLCVKSLSLFHSFTLSLFHSFTLSLFHSFTLSLFHSFTFLIHCAETKSHPPLAPHIPSPPISPAPSPALPPGFPPPANHSTAPLPPV